MQSYFTNGDNFLAIIRQHVPQVLENSVSFIKTGWTNIVICASDGKDEYFFRFPRNSFFARMMLKDHSFCTFIKDKITFRVPELQLFYDNDRPFSMHKKIRGWSLSERLKFLSQQAVTNVAYDVVRLIKELDQVDPRRLPNACNMYVSKFLDELSTVSGAPYDEDKMAPLRAEEAKPHTVHGDLNPGNILLDENDRVIGVIDFAFAGISGRYTDISRMLGRTTEKFKRPLLEAYRSLMHRSVDQKQAERIVRLWNHVEERYIAYIRKNHPEIQLPEKVK